MSLSAWLSHRELLLGFDSHEALAEAAGLRADVVQAIALRDNLQKVSRSTRAFLARALEVTVRDLESLAAGKADWIPDTRRVDWARTTPDCLRISRTYPTIQTAELISAPLSRGIVVVGRISADGVVQFLDDNAENEGHRLPVRVAGAPDAFALEATVRLGICPHGASVIFRGLPPGELQDEESALLTISDVGETYFRKVRCVNDHSLAIRQATGDQDWVVNLEIIVRAARVIGIYGDAICDENSANSDLTDSRGVYENGRNPSRA